MAEETSDGTGSFILKNTQNYHHMKIDVVKFDGTFRLWKCEVLDALNAQNLEENA